MYKTPEEIAYGQYLKLHSVPERPTGSYLRRIMVEAIEADRDQISNQLETGFKIPEFKRFEHSQPNLNPVAAAEAYNQLEPEDLHVGIMTSYMHLERVLISQFAVLRDAGMTFEWVTGEPYPNSAAMHRDVLENAHLKVRRTLGEDYNDLPDKRHPMNRIISTDYGRHRLNNVFRAVHDVVGHAATRSSFGPDGECVAWLEHRSTMPYGALMALWCETRGQNTWTNFYGSHSELPLKDRPVAVQKFGNVDRSLI